MNYRCWFESLILVALLAFAHAVHAGASDLRSESGTWKATEDFFSTLNLKFVKELDHDTLKTRTQRGRSNTYLQSSSPNERAKFSIAHSVWLMQQCVEFQRKQYHRLENKRVGLDAWVRQQQAEKKFEMIYPKVSYQVQRDFTVDWWSKNSKNFQKLVGDKRETWVHECLLDDNELNHLRFEGCPLPPFFAYKLRLQDLIVGRRET